MVPGPALVLLAVPVARGRTTIGPATSSQSRSASTASATSIGSPASLMSETYHDLVGLPVYSWCDDHGENEYLSISPDGDVLHVFGYNCKSVELKAEDLKIEEGRFVGTR